MEAPFTTGEFGPRSNCENWIWNANYLHTEGNVCKISCNNIPNWYPIRGFTPGNKTPPTRTLSSINTVLFGIGSVKMIFVAVVFPIFSNKTVYVKMNFQVLRQKIVDPHFSLLE